jgi:microcystin-dependent protein
MSEAIPLTITLASLPPDWTGNVHSYDATIPGRIVISAQQAIALFRSGTTEPTSDEGLWFDETTGLLKYYDYDTGGYVPVNVPQQNLKYAVSSSAPSQTDYLLWIVLDANGQGEDVRTYYNGAWRSVLVGTARALAVFKSTGEGLDTLDAGTSGQVLTSQGPGLLPVFATYDPTPVGTVIWRPYTPVPSGYVAAEGQSLLRTTYPNLHALAAADGYPHGSGDGVNTFNIIDMRGRFPLGYGTGTAADATAHTLGQEAGTETHTLTDNQIPAHTHNVTYHEVDEGGDPQYPGGTTATDTGPLTAATTSVGGSASHNNMPPYGVGRWFIRAA